MSHWLALTIALGTLGQSGKAADSDNPADRLAIMKKSLSTHALRVR